MLKSTRRSRRGGVIAKALIALLVLGGLAVAAVSIMRSTGSGSTAADAPDLFTVDRRTFDVTSTASGELQAKQETRLVSQVESRTTIVEVVDEGSFVRKGDVLVRLSTDALERELVEDELRLNSAQSELTAAQEAYEIQLSDNDSALRKATLNLRLAKLDLEKWEQGDDKERRLQLDLDIERAVREEKRLREKLERQEKLYERDFISSDELERDRIAYIEAQSQLQKTNLAKTVYEKFTATKEFERLDSNVEEATAELERTKRRNRSQINSKESNLTNKQRQLAIRETRVEYLEEQMSSATITAPTDGLVVYATSLRRDWRGNGDGPLKVGTEVYHNQELIVLPDTAEMVAAIRIHESRIGEVSEGMGVQITIDAVPGRVFDGIVSQIGIMAESGGWRDPNNREYEVKVNLALDNTDQALKPSMRCEAKVIINEVADVVAVPVQGVFSEGRVTYVFRDEGGVFRRHPVQVGRRSDTFAEITDGLTPDDVISLREPPINRVIPGEFDAEVLAQFEGDRRGTRGGPPMGVVRETAH